MSGKWRVFSQYAGAEKIYIVGRVRDTSKPLHGGNVEYSGGYTSNESEAEELAAAMNEGA